MWIFVQKEIRCKDAEYIGLILGQSFQLLMDKPYVEINETMQGFAEEIKGLEEV